jgi:ATP-dependent Zn protease
MGMNTTSPKAEKLELYKTAIHESGHALISRSNYSDVSKLYKVTIQKRGNSLGHNMSLWMKETEDIPMTELYRQIDILLGGRAAEEVIFGNECITTGKLFSFRDIKDTKLVYNSN